MNRQELLRRIPKVDQVLSDRRLVWFLENIPRDLVVESIQETVNEIRSSILKSEGDTAWDLNFEKMIDRILNKLEEKSRKSLRRTINATGVVLHTNLGRAKLSKAACLSVQEAAEHYSTLEYDVKKGVRGSRHDHVESLIRKVTGAEGAMVVNNNAAATMLCLSALASGKEVIVSRGELVEIGGSFRIPEIMEQSGAVLKEVGTTNKTKIEDYCNAVNVETTGALMKIHTSNYRIIGFTAEASLEDLAALGKQKGIPVIYDLGSGLMVDLKRYGIDEPVVPESIRTGVDVILFSGDKLFGGPQGGIIAGKKELIDKMKKHPLARVLRVDKMTLAAMEATLREYMDPEKAVSNVPVLSMIAVNEEELKERAKRLVDGVKNKVSGIEIKVVKSQGQVGGGSAPGTVLPGYAAAVSGTDLSLEKLERELREWDIPIIARIYRDHMYFDVRTVTDEEIRIISEALEAAVKKQKGERVCTM